MENENPQVPTPVPEEPKAPENGEGQPEPTDYKAELEKVKKQLGQAEHTIIQLKKEKDNAPEGEEGDDQTDIAEIARKEAGKVFANVFKSQAKALAQRIAESTDEAELIMFHYENTITSTGDLETDMRRAKLLANEGRISKDLEQARKAALAKELKGKAGGEGGGKEPISEGPPPMSEKDKKLLKGFTWTTKGPDGKNGNQKGWIGKSGRFHPHIAE